MEFEALTSDVYFACILPTTGEAFSAGNCVVAAKLLASLLCAVQCLPQLVHEFFAERLIVSGLIGDYNGNVAESDPKDSSESSDSDEDEDEEEDVDDEDDDDADNLNEEDENYTDEDTSEGGPGGEGGGEQDDEDDDDDEDEDDEDDEDEEEEDEEEEDEGKEPTDNGIGELPARKTPQSKEKPKGSDLPEKNAIEEKSKANDRPDKRKNEVELPSDAVKKSRK